MQKYAVRFLIYDKTCSYWTPRMVFTPKHHGYIATATILYLPALLIARHASSDAADTSTYYATMLTASIQTADDLPLESKLQLMRNHTSGQIDPWAHHQLVLQFTKHVVDTHSIAVLFGLLSMCYGLISIAWAKNEDRCGGQLQTTFDASTVGSDAAALLTDNLFWLIFTVFHVHQFLALIAITTLDDLLLFTFGSLCLTWALCNRMLARYPPALIATSLFFFSLQTKTFYDVAQRDADLWTTHFVLTALDGMLITCHVVDDVLTTSTALNCRISYMFAASLTMLTTSIFLQRNPQ